MCGIAGFVNAEGTVEQQAIWINQMTEAIRHRGPDGAGTYINPPVVLGHRRLSIIDLQTGGQPMKDDSNESAIVFNGEIYNFHEIRDDLEKKGHQFKTKSDTEVLLKAYLCYGEKCLDALEGMFAFVIWDAKSKSLFAARDRLGKKPFYYTIQNGIFAFASELLSFRNLPFIRLEIDKKSIARYLTYEYVPTPHSIYRNIFKLRPGHFLKFREGNLETRRYWDLPVPHENTALSDEECCERIRSLLGGAVKKRLISDVPLGVFLSGGIDSSAVVALMSEIVSGHEIKTFSIGFQESSYDESPYSRLVSKQFGTDHYEEILSALDAGSLLPDIVSRQDEPMSDPSVVPTFLLSQITRKKVTVALGGDGGDELFGGYEYFTGSMLSDYYLKIPKILRDRVIKPVCNFLPSSTGYVNPRHVAQKFINGAEAPEWLRSQIWVGAFSQDFERALWTDFPFSPSDPLGLYNETRRLFQNFRAATSLDKVFYLFAKQYLLDYILVKVDRCSMMNALEVRAPFLDKDVVEFVFSLPSRLKIKRFERKYLLKKALKNHLPASILHRKKRGFLIPTALWLKQNLRPLVEETLGERNLKEQGLFEPKIVAEMVSLHNEGRVDYRKELWTLLVLQLWLKSNPSSMV
ncbi:MAG: asparagine synthase (glutamine-hydrolyzing) [Desulfomonilaceae bacterium]